MNEHALFWLHGTAKRALMFWRQRSHCECRLSLCGTVIDKVLSGRWRDISAGKTVTRAVDLPHMSSYITRLIQPPPLPLFRCTLAWTLILILPKKNKQQWIHAHWQKRACENCGSFLFKISVNIDFSALKMFVLNFSDRKVFRLPHVYGFTVGT